MRELSTQELVDLEKSGVSQEELAKHWDMFPGQDFVTAVGAVVGLKQGVGQERNEPFNGVGATDSDRFVPTPPADAVSTPVTELPESDPQHVAVGENGWPVAEAPVVEAAPAEGLSEAPATQE